MEMLNISTSVSSVVIRGWHYYWMHLKPYIAIVLIVLIILLLIKIFYFDRTENYLNIQNQL